MGQSFSSPLFFPHFFILEAEERERFRNELDKWLKKTTPDDTGLTRPPVAMRVSAHKDEVRSIVHGYFQSQFRVSVYKVVGRSRQDSIKREEDLTTVTNTFMEQ